MFLVGSGPLPAQDPRQMGFPALRTRQFLVALLEAGHEVALAALEDPGPDEPAREGPPAQRTLEQPTATGPRRLSYHAVDARSPGALLALRDLRHTFAPDVVVSAGPFRAMAGGARAVGDEPLWVDVPGDPMSEAQLRAHRSGRTDPIHRYRQVFSLALSRGDRFSVIARTQRPTLVGALGLAGRLTAPVVGQPLVEVIRPSLEGLHRDCPPQPADDLLAGLGSDTFAVLIGGGYNTWLDAETTLRGVLRAMDADDRVQLVSTGGALPGHHEGGYAWFRRQARRSRHAARFHFLGWIPARQLDAVFGACDLALNVDLPCYEAEFGSRTRLLDAVERGLAIAATDGCELTADLRGVHGFHPLQPGDAEQVAAVIVRLAADKRRRLAGRRRTDRGRGARANAPGNGVRRKGRQAPGDVDRRAVLDDGTPGRRPWSELRPRYSLAETTAPLLAWVDEPTRTHADEAVDFLEDQWREIAQLQDRLEEVWSSPTWRYLGRVHRAVKTWRR